MTVSEALYDMLETDEFRISPVAAVYASRQPIRRHLANAIVPTTFRCCSELRAEGATDYAAFPLLFTDGTVHVATWTTRQPGGFTPQQFADLEAIIAPLTRVAEIRALRRTATNLLDTYVGRQAGERILAGRDPARHVEDDPRRDLALGHARIYRARPSDCRRRSWSTCSTAISTARCRRSSSTAARCSSSSATGCWRFFRSPANGDDAGEVCRARSPARARRRL